MYSVYLDIVCLLCRNKKLVIQYKELIFHPITSLSYNLNDACVLLYSVWWESSILVSL